MSYLQLVPDEHIEKLEKEEHERFSRMLDAHQESKEAAWEMRERWLSVFEQALSPEIACRQSGISKSTYRRWRKTDPKFCRALNRIIEEAHENMIGSAYARATGYLKSDPETESGFEEDATGRPIRHGVSDRLAIALINGRERVRQQQPSSVSVKIDLAALGIDNHKDMGGDVIPLRLPSPIGDVVDGEFTAVEESDQ